MLSNPDPASHDIQFFSGLIRELGKRVNSPEDLLEVDVEKVYQLTSRAQSQIFKAYLLETELPKTIASLRQKDKQFYLQQSWKKSIRHDFLKRIRAKFSVPEKQQQYFVL